MNKRIKSILSVSVSVFLLSMSFLVFQHVPGKSRRTMHRGHTGSCSPMWVQTVISEAIELPQKSRETKAIGASGSAYPSSILIRRRRESSSWAILSWVPGSARVRTGYHPLKTLKELSE